MSTTTTSPEQSPFVAVDTVQGEKTGRYIVMLKEGAAQADVLSSISSIRGLQPDAGVTHEYDAINGFAGNFDGDTLAALQRQPGVASIVEDSMVYTTTVSTGQPWGLARISSERRLTGTESDLIYSYNYNDLAGVGVDIYIVDTGIRVTHQDFGGRASWAGAVPPYAQVDGNGHGTHCAATAVGTKFGVAKRANVLAVKVLSDAGSGSVSDVIAGLNIALNRALATGRPSVVSMSLGGSASPALDAAALVLIKRGIHVVVAAGNDNTDASSQSPARLPQAVTVGASTIEDERAIFSNFGPLVDTFAPGRNVISAWKDSDTATKSLSGTSMATPHVAGLIAYLISVNGNASPFIMSHAVKSTAFKGALNPLTLRECSLASFIEDSSTDSISASARLIAAGTTNLLISNTTIV
ncbi:hypothetical protein NMY22_g4971 [Coprinellus aureogranulatus]|nr:hypothetical protein NMY22_g4971 [Coprinellus aureogranulatus]